MSEKKMKTRERILQAASQVFAEHGFEKGTVREICTRAQANVAAVNYHFRDKRELYMRVLDAWEKESDERFPIANGVSSDAPAPERIKGLFTSFLRRIFFSGDSPDESHKRARVIMHEIASGTHIKERREEDSYCRVEAVMRANLIELMPGASPLLVQDCVDSSMSQVTACFMHFVYDPHEYQDMLSYEEVDRLAAHMTTFALGGIRAVLEAAGEDAAAVAA